MKVRVDLKLCEGNQRCVDSAPEVFEVRDDDQAHLLIERPPSEQWDRVKLAVRMCPRQAISIVEE
jgi:ferredoxin